MDTKKFSVLFGFVLVAFLAGGIILSNYFKAIRYNDFQRYTSTVTTIVKQKNYQIGMLRNLLAEEARKNYELNRALAETKNDLDSLSKRLAQQAPVPPAAASGAPIGAVAAK